MNIKILVDDKNYKNYNFYNSDTLELLENLIDINPIQHKLFSGDIFTINNDKSINLIHSVVKSLKLIAGILIKNKTYGRIDNNKLLYKCIPNDKRIPDFLVPINNKIKGDNFSKNIMNSYIVFSFSHWNDKHPLGELKQTIGNVNEINNFYEYQLYCKNLNFSLQQFNNAASRILKKSKEKNIITKIYDLYGNIENRLDEFVFSIDNNGSLDLDDAISIKEVEIDKGKGKDKDIGKDIDNPTYKISIYITNVAVLIDYFDLWDSFSERISTIYLPDRKRPMLPTILSDHLCSLKENESRIVFGIDIFYDGVEIKDIKYNNSVIKVSKNYRYESKELLSCPYYNKLFTITKSLLKQKKYISNINNSHDIIAYYMLFLNNQIAKLLVSHKLGIFRTLDIKKIEKLPDNLPEEVEKFINIVYGASGRYTSYLEINNMHLSEEIDIYIHVSSPIRRLIDLLNLIQYHSILGGKKLSNNAYNFYNKWFNKLEYINETMRSIKKVQNICSLLYNISINNEILNNSYEGYIINKILRNDGLYFYSIYIPELKLLSKLITNKDLDIFKNYKFKIYIFVAEINIKKKIRLELII